MEGTEIGTAKSWGRKIRSRLRRSRWNLFGTLVRVDTPDPVVALTFDDGPDPAYTPRLLDILDRHGAGATFFMVGAAAQRHPGLVEEVAARGHCVGNHTHTHPSLPTLPGRKRRREIRRCARALGPHGSRFFRPPKGHQTVGSRLDAFWCRHSAVAWSVAADDWRPHEAEWIASKVMDRLSPGDIVLLHDGLWDPESREAADRQPVLDAVRILLRRCHGRYTFATLPELLDRGSQVRQSWFNPPTGTPEEAGG